MDWILSIFNVVLLLFFLGCARTPEVSKVKENPSPRPVEKLVSGPTRSVLSREIASKSFGEVGAEIGLAGLNGVHLYGVDFDGDGYTDLVILPDFYSIPQFFRFHPSSKKFRKLTYSPFKVPTRASFLGFADFNKDGLLDLVMGTLNQRSALTPRPLMLFQGIKTDGRLHYKEVPKAFPKNIDPVASIAFIDYDLDGFLDIYVGNWYVRSQSGKTTLAPDRLYKGDQFRFVDHSHVLEGEFDFNKSYESYPNARPTFGVSVCDIDQNGYPDILTAASGGFGNRLWLSMPSKKVPGERVFRDHGEQSGYAFDDDGKHTTRGGGIQGIQSVQIIITMVLWMWRWEKFFILTKILCAIVPVY